MTGKEIIEIAKNYLGYNGKKFCSDYGMAFGNHWCCAFVWDIFRIAKASKLFYGGAKTAYVPTAQVWLKAHCKHVKMTEAKAGDIVVFTWSGNGYNNQKGSRDHIGFIRAKGTSTVCKTIEGNTGANSPKTSTVKERTRDAKYVYGIYRPNYTTKTETKAKGLTKIVDYAKKRASEGIPYTNTNPSWKGCDCHWFTSHVYKDCGYDEVYKLMTKSGKPYLWQKPWDKTRLSKYLVQHNDKGLDESKLLPGDIIFKKLDKNPNGYHSAIYISKGKIADATHKRGVSINKFTKKYIYAFRIPEKKEAAKKEEKKQEKGFDISYAQNGLTLDGFKKAKKAGWDFVIIRLGTILNGKMYTDKEFESKYKLAKKAGLKVGIYWYAMAINTETAKKEAAYVLKVMNKREIDLPIFYDLEDKRQAKLGKAKNKALCDAFCKAITDGGYKAGVYASYDWLTNRIGEINKKYMVWLAQYPKATYKGRYEIHQYSSTAKVEGIGARIDANIKK